MCQREMKVLQLRPGRLNIIQLNVQIALKEQIKLNTSKTNSGNDRKKTLYEVSVIVQYWKSATRCALQIQNLQICMNYG